MQCVIQTLDFFSTGCFEIDDISGEYFCPCGSKFFPGKYYSGSTLFPGNYNSGSNFFRGVIIYGSTGHHLSAQIQQFNTEKSVAFVPS